MPNIIKHKTRPEIPTGSMADIVFLLLVFFLVTTTMDQDKGVGMHLPPSETLIKVPKQNICHLWVNASGGVLIDHNERIDLEEVQGRIVKRLQNNAQLIISLMSDANTEYRHFIQVLDEVKLAGATRISLASPTK